MVKIIKKTKKKKKTTKKELKRLDRIKQKKRLKKWSVDVRNRDGNKCSICSSIKYIHAHHIIPKEIKEFKFDLENGIALCAKHHRYSREISAHQNPFTFMIWFEKNRKEQYILLLSKLDKGGYNNFDKKLFETERFK